MMLGHTQILLAFVVGQFRLSKGRSATHTWKCTMANEFREGRSLLRQLALIPLERNDLAAVIAYGTKRVHQTEISLDILPEVRKRTKVAVRNDGCSFQKVYTDIFLHFNV